LIYLTQIFFHSQGMQTGKRNANSQSAALRSCPFSVLDTSFYVCC
jgi:hypothetical protein